MVRTWKWENLKISMEDSSENMEVRFDFMEDRFDFVEDRFDFMEDKFDFMEVGPFFLCKNDTLPWIHFLNPSSTNSYTYFHMEGRPNTHNK